MTAWRSQKRSLAGNLLSYCSQCLRAGAGLAQPAPQFAVIRVEKFMERRLELAPQVACPLLMEFCLSEHRSGVLCELA